MAKKYTSTRPKITSPPSKRDGDGNHIHDQILLDLPGEESDRLLPKLATVLCIDDDPRILELYRGVLAPSEYTVLTALDGLTCIALTRAHSIDAIVLDFTMAGLDGNAVAQVLTKEQPDLPVVVCSRCLDDVPESLKWYADALLKKTDGPEALVSALEKLINSGFLRKKAVARRSFTAGEPLVA